MKVLVWTDGGSRGNPGPAATGWVVKSEKGLPVMRDGKSLGSKTNNEAEYAAVIQALSYVAETWRELDMATEVILHSDSALVVGQVSKGWRVNVPHLLPLRDEVQRLVKLFPKVTFVQVPREQNREADAVVNAVLDGRWK